MTTPSDSGPPFVRSVLHPTDFSEASASAFAHALAIALIAQASLTLLHASTAPSEESFPRVRRTLERWGLLAPGSPRSAVFDELRVRVKRVTIETDRLVPGMLEYLAREPVDLLVLGTEGREGPARLVRQSVAEPVARHTGIQSLFVPDAGTGFVDPATGRLSLRRILVPIDDEPAPERALAYATRAASALGEGPDSPGEIGVLRVDDWRPASGADPDLPEGPSWRFTRLFRRGPVVDEIEASVKEFEADLVVMPTAGHHGVLDASRGSTTEQVLRRVACPLLAVPST